MERKTVTTESREAAAGRGFHFRYCFPHCGLTPATICWCRFAIQIRDQFHNTRINTLGGEPQFLNSLCGLVNQFSPLA